MKKVLLMSIFALALMFSANAQEQTEKATKGQKRSATERAEALTKRMSKKLSLDAAQLERVKTINLETAKRVDEVRATMKDNRKEGKTKIMAIEAEREATFKQILKEDQMKTYLEMRKKKVDKMQKGKGAKAGKADVSETVEDSVE